MIVLYYNEMRKLYKQQEKLQASTTRIEKMLKELQDSSSGDSMF